MRLPNESPQDIRLRIPVLNSAKEVVSHREYSFNEDDLIGKGTFGSVYKIYPIDTKTNKVLRDRPLAVKVFDIARLRRDGRNDKEIKELITTETESFARYYRAEAPLYIGDQVYFIMEYFKGHDLIIDDGDRDVLAPPFQNLSFGKTLELIQEICNALNLYHHHTRRGDALLHNDLKGTNIRADITPEGRINIYIIDFGLSTRLKQDDPTIKNKLPTGGTLDYTPPETWYGEKGIKSDIYSLVPIFLFLFGVQDPFRNKVQAQLNNEYLGSKVAQLASLNAKYNFDGLLEKFKNNVGAMGVHFKHLIRLFLQRMQDIYAKRPDTTELLKFFTLLNGSYKIHQERQRIDELLAQTKSYSEAGELKAQRSGLEKSLAKNLTILILLSFSLLNKENEIFADHPLFQKHLLNLYESNSITSGNVTILTASLEDFEQDLNLAKNQIKTLEGSGYSKPLIHQLEYFAEEDPAADFVDRLRNLKEKERSIINNLMYTLNKHGVVISRQDFALILSGNELDLRPAFKACINTFIEKMEIAARSHPTSLLSSFFRYDPGEEISVAKKLLAQFNGMNVTLSPREEKIIAAGELRSLRNDFTYYRMELLQKGPTL
jgi:serine/threonine protein kinase